jgi:hypothetical protein
LLNISLRKLAELLRDLEGLVLGHDVLPDYIICNSGGFKEATRFGRSNISGQRRRRSSAILFGAKLRQFLLSERCGLDGELPAQDV